jgi:DNA-binding LacI/PurR family transcriptional regulator
VELIATRRLTIADVARHAGVSKGAVSFALNGREGVSSETRARILESARALGWQPSHRARALSVSRSFAVGLVLARAPELLGADPFFPSFIAGVETVLATAGYSLMLQVVPAPAAEADGYRRLAAEGRVDGVLVCDLRTNDSRIALLAELGLTAVTLNRPDVPSPFPAVCFDDQAGVRSVVRHLAELGHTRIGHISGPVEFMHSVSRRDAWSGALAEAGLKRGPLVASDFTAAGGAAATVRMLKLKDPPTAIVYANDVMAIAGIGAARNRGLRVPDDLSLAGFDGTELASHIHPPLTTISTDPLRWGQAAATTLLALINGAGALPDVHLEPGQVELRDSTGPPPSSKRKSATQRRQSGVARGKKSTTLREK